MSCCVSLAVSRFDFSHILCQRGYLSKCYLYRGVIAHNNFKSLLLENISHTSPTSNPNTRPCPPRTTERRRDWNQCRTIQEDSVQCTMGANDLTGLLSANGFNRICCCFYWTANTIFVPRYVYIIYGRVFKLISKPISVRLEDEGSETSSEGHDQRILVFELTDQVTDSLANTS